MGGFLFWVIVVAVIIFNAVTTKNQETEKKSSTPKRPGSSWQDITQVLRSKPDEQRRVAKSRRKTDSEVDFRPIEVKTENARADLIPVWEAAGRREYEIVEQKLAAGAYVNEPDTFFGETALHRAAKVGDLKMVELLLSYGARVDLQNQYGETPLHFAIRGRNPEVIRMLLANGADPDTKDIFGRTPAHCARFYTELRDCFAGLPPT